MTLQEAIQARHSVRAYTPYTLSSEESAALQERIDEYNKAGGLHIQLALDEPRAFKSRFNKYGLFSNVTNYLVIAGRPGEGREEKAGYYGELLVLQAQTLGLNTCWVGLTYSKVEGAYVLDEGEKIFCVIALGRGETQGSDHRRKTVEQVSNATSDTPSWFNDGVSAALLAPTAVNQQKFSFTYLPPVGAAKAKVLAKKGFSLVGYAAIDLGIAKCHFELAAGTDSFEWA